MILAKFAPYKWLAIGLLFAAVTAWGGLGWYGKAGAEREFAEYQLAASNVIAERLVANSKLEAQARTLSQEADAQYLKGKKDADREFKPIRDDLAFLRHAWGMRNQNDSSPVPGESNSASLSNPRACTDEPRRIIEAASRVVEDLKTCRDVASQLEACRAYAVGVRCQQLPRAVEADVSDAWR